MTEKEFLKQYEKRTKTIEGWATKLFFRALQKQVASAVGFQRAMPNFIVQIDNFVTDTEINKAYQRLYSRVGVRFAASMYKHIAQNIVKKKADEPSVQGAIGFFNAEWEEKIRYFLFHSAERIKKVTETTKRKIAQLLMQAAEKRLNIRDTADYVASKMATINRTRAMLIARTETTIVANFAHTVGADSIAQQGFDLKKKWYSFIDLKTRLAHRMTSISPNPIDKDDFFVLDGEKLRFPGDTGLGASGANVCNCRCVISYTVKR